MCRIRIGKAEPCQQVSGRPLLCPRQNKRTRRQDCKREAVLIPSRAAESESDRRSHALFEVRRHTTFPAEVPTATETEMVRIAVSAPASRDGIRRWTLKFLPRRRQSCIGLGVSHSSRRSRARSFPSAMGSTKTFALKQKLAHAQKQNRPIPQWSWGWGAHSRNSGEQ